MSWPDPITLLPLLAHLSTIGELYPAELDRAAQPWLSLLAKAGWVSPLADGAYAATDAYLSLPTGLSATERLRRICFSIPNYRRYLIAILAEGLVGAGQVDYYKQLEQWVIGDLSALAEEINIVLDELEAGQGRMVEWSPGRVTACFADWHAEHDAFAEWDQTLLGLSGTPTQSTAGVPIGVNLPCRLPSSISPPEMWSVFPLRRTYARNDFEYFSNLSH